MVEEAPFNEIQPIKEGLVIGGGESSDDVHLLGSQCENCGEVSIGTNSVCLNCGSDQIEAIKLSSEGELWTYTVIRHKPPGDYIGPEPFEPFALGLVELPDGVRIMSPLEGDVDSFQIGAKLRLAPWILKSKDGTAYRAFRFAPAGS
jgi:uncharacterized OB-fold protein